MDNLTHSRLSSSPLLISSKRISSCHYIEDFVLHIDQCLQKLKLVCNYQLHIDKKVLFNHFDEGRIVKKDLHHSHGRSEKGKSKVIHLESSSTYKLHFVQLHIEHTGSPHDLNDGVQDVLMLWLQQLETWCHMWEAFSSHEQEH